METFAKIPGCEEGTFYLHFCANFCILYFIMHYSVYCLLWKLTVLNSTSSFTLLGSPTEDSQKSSTIGMAGLVLSLLSSAWFPLDLSAHQDALILAGNLLAGRKKVQQ